MRLKRFSELTFIMNSQRLVFDSQGCIKLLYKIQVSFSLNGYVVVFQITFTIRHIRRQNYSIFIIKKIQIENLKICNFLSGFYSEQIH